MKRLFKTFYPYDSLTSVSIAVFAGVYAVLRLFPTFPIFGIGNFRLSDILPTTYGIILDPTIAVAAIIVGTFLSIILGVPPIFFGLDFLPAIMNALMVGLLLRGKKLIILVIYISLIALFSIHPYGVILINGSIPFLWFHLIILILLLSPLSSQSLMWLRKRIGSGFIFHCIFLSFVGTLTQHLTGSILTATLYSGLILKQGIITYWKVVFFLYPFERLFIAIFSTFLCVALLKTLKKANPKVSLSKIILS
jgi:hypothetical protein